MRYKLAFISDNNPKNDYIFYIEMPDPFELDLWLDNVNKAITDGHVEKINESRVHGKHEVSSF